MTQWGCRIDGWHDIVKLEWCWFDGLKAKNELGSWERSINGIWRLSGETSSQMDEDLEVGEGLSK